MTAKLIKTLTAAFAMLGVSYSYAQPYAPMPTTNLLTGSSGISYPNANVWTDYSFNYTPTVTGSGYVGFSFRNDNRYWYFGNVSLTTGGGSNLLSNGNMTAGGAIASLGPNVQGNPMNGLRNWGVGIQTGFVATDVAREWYPNNAGDPIGILPSYSGGQGVYTPTAGVWADGTFGGFSSLYQALTLVASNLYTLTFSVYSDTVSTPGPGYGYPTAQLGVYAGQCNDPSANPVYCEYPISSGFVTYATPLLSQTAGGGVQVVPPDIVASNNSANGFNTISSVGNTNFNNVFAGGTLNIDTSASTPSNFGISSTGYLNQNGNVGTFTGVFSDSGSSGRLYITNSGSAGIGKIRLLGVNTHTGGTDILEGANLEINSSTALGTGTLSLVGNSARTVTATLSSTADLTITNPITVSYDPTFNVTSGTTLTIDSVISDGVASGDVVTTGGGTVKLTNVNTYTGTTTVNNGSTLTLSGLGSITPSSIITNHGSFNISPKTSDVSLNGNYVQSNNGALGMSLTPSNNPRLLINGTANLSGALTVNASPGYYSTARYTLITATSGLSGTFSSLITNLANYTSDLFSLTYDSNNVYLLLSTNNTGPSVEDTQSSLVSSARKLKGIYNTLSTNLMAGLSYDCQLFDVNNICISTGGRYSTSNVDGSANNSTSALLIGAYRYNKNVRVGGWIDQNTSFNTPAGTNINSSTPIFGLFGNWAQHSSGEGYEIKVAAAHGSKDLTITRDVIGNSEAGTGSTSLNGYAISTVSSYGFNVNKQILASPYLGAQYNRSVASEYSESSANISSPLTFNRLVQENLSLVSGLRISAKIDPKVTLFGSAGIEQGVNNRNSKYSATGVNGLASVDFDSNVNKTRLTAYSGAAYSIDKNQRISISALYREEAFSPKATKSLLATYMVGL